MVIIQLKPLDKIAWNASDVIRVWYTQDSKRWIVFLTDTIETVYNNG